LNVFAKKVIQELFGENSGTQKDPCLGIVDIAPFIKLDRRAPKKLMEKLNLKNMFGTSQHNYYAQINSGPQLSES